MATKKTTAAAAKVKNAAKKQPLDPPAAKGKKRRGAPLTDQDPKRRLGNYEGAGEPPLRGSRMTGIGGQSKQKYGTDKKKSKKK